MFAVSTYSKTQVQGQDDPQCMLVGAGEAAEVFL